MADKILVIEDEVKIARTMRLYLEQEGYQVVAIHDGALALPALRIERPDLVLLDLMLPHVDGREICRQIRHESAVPIIMLTARSDESDKLIGLELGADDYITKPFSPREVVARVRAVLRRTRGLVQPSPLLRLGKLEIDLEQRIVIFNENLLDLTPIEYDLLVRLASHPGQVFTRLQLLEATQTVAYVGYERSIDQHIKNLRAKLQDDARNPTYILTVFGVGYRFPRQEKPNA
ncbi:MAG: response regulator transcription factor [Anaerolineales bacterium]|uniref:Response regulator transcription factor n=1 Tax=Candidatus Desulfolinea nitratireducens TaxID=2841698 RepID=A0A8J6TJU0_9CHLR|nr:response regulator transcription factor [Candidatus Desulfolinea nitratireducens]MBL6960522.1 response regulator transcription factor [Anaerolineales bacterium]